MLVRWTKTLGLRLDQGAELEVGVLGEEPLHDGPVLGPQGPLDVEHANPAVHHLNHRRPLVVLGDLLIGDRRNSHGEVCRPLTVGTNWNETSWSSSPSRKTTSAGLGGLAVLFEHRLDDLARQP